MLLYMPLFHLVRTASTDVACNHQNIVQELTTDRGSVGICIHIKGQYVCVDCGQLVVTKNFAVTD